MTPNAMDDNRVHVKWVTPDKVCAVVRGDSGIYDVRRSGDRWRCSCQSIGCGHVHAVQSVTEPERGDDRRGS